MKPDQRINLISRVAGNIVSASRFGVGINVRDEAIIAATYIVDKVTEQETQRKVEEVNKNEQ